jgi:adenylate cyclase
MIEPLAMAHGGRLFKTTGDGFLAEFASAVQALRCAIAIQEKLRAQPDGVRLRIGVHQGEVVVDGDDLLGDGVIIAARLEPLAEPGGICISARVREDATGKMAPEVDDLGTPELKNIAAKIQVFRVRLGLAESPALPLPEKPSLVVLPFPNMSGDPEQEYFADGMVEEITTALSRIRWLFVIARNSAFTYKGRAVDVRQVGRELGVRYVLEGSVRKAGSRVRITGQLVEAATGAHLWADRFDGTLEDVFDLQDQVTASVVGAIEPNLRAAEIMLAQRKPTESLRSYDLALRALAVLKRIDWESLTEAERLAQAALALDGNNPAVLHQASWILALPGGDLKSGITLINRSIELNPNSAVALQRAGMLHAYAGDKQLAIAQLERSQRLNPLAGAVELYFAYALAHFVASEFEPAADWTAKALHQSHNHAASLRYRAASLGLLGRLEEGRQVAQQLLALVPGFTITRARRHIEFDMNNVFKTPGVADALYEGLRRCGVPE